MFIKIKGIQHEITEENGVLVYKNHFCGCPCQQNIIYPINKNSLNSHKQKGIPNFIKGHCNKTPKAKDKISKRMSGKNHPLYGKHHTKETRKKQKLAHLGEKNYNYGYHRTEESKLKQSINHPDFSNENNPFFNKKHKKSSKKLISQNHADFSGKNNPMYGVQSPHGKKIFIHPTPSQGILKMFKWEHLLAKYYDEKNIFYLYEPKAFPLIINNKNYTYTPDFYLPNTDEYIEVKGYWRDDSKPKFNKFLETYPDIKIQLLMEQNLKNLGVNLKEKI